MLRLEYGKDKLPYDKVAIAVGLFDGVHIAHRELMLTTVREARDMGIPAGVFTFTGDIKSSSTRIYTDDEKLDIIESLGIDFVITASFADIAGKSAEEFCVDILHHELGVALAVVGYNFKFGKGAVGTPDLLESIFASLGKRTIVVPEMTLDGKAVSSTRIREALAKGNMKAATDMLGAPYFVSGKVEHGIGQGRDTLGYPTVNVRKRLGSADLPFGVYRAAVACLGKIYSAVCNLGKCPTLSPREAHFEAHIINFSEPVYDEQIKIYLLEFLREEIAFDTVEELKMQIKVDLERTIKANGEAKWITTGQK